jgi:hypothetical protein
MTFDWRKFVQIAEAIAPMTLAAAGVPPALTGLVIHAVSVAQQTTDGVEKTGPEKKALAMSIIQDGLSAVNVARPKTFDVPQLTTVVSQGVDVTIAAINAAKNIPVKQV